MHSFRHPSPWFFCCAIAAAAPLAAQAEPTQEKPAADGGAKPQPLPLIPPHGAPRRAPGANRPVESIDAMRDQRTAAVSRSGSFFDLDLSAVDWKADPVLIADGRPITRAEVDREVCVLLGTNEIDQFVTAVLVRRIKKEMAAKGQPLPSIEITEEDVQKKLDEDKKVLPQFSGVTAEQYEQQIRELFGWSHYVEFQKGQLEFERILLPDPPADFITKQAAKAAALDATWKTEVDAKLKSLQKEGQPPLKPNDPEVQKLLPPRPVPEADLSFIPSITWELMDARFAPVIRDGFYARGMAVPSLARQAVVSSVRTSMLKNLEVRLAPPEDAENLLFVGDEPVKLKEMLSLVSVRADDAVRRLALREILNTRAADRRLELEHATETAAEGDAAFKALEDEYARSIIPLAQAVKLFGFNSVWHYRPFFVRKHAYKQMLARTVSEDNLRAHYDRDGRIFFENGTVTSEVLFIPGDARADAKRKIDELMGAIAGGTPFAVIAHDPAKNGFPDGRDVKSGQVAPLLRTMLRMALGESEYIAWLTGYSLADEAFYVAKEDSVVGPVWRDYSPKLTGWIALHVERFFTTGQRHPFEESKDRVLDDLADITFPRWVNESLAHMNLEFPH